MEQAIDLRFNLRTSLLPLGELGRILDYLREAESLALTLGDQRRLGRLSAYMTNYFFVTGNQDRALESGQRGLAIATALDDFALKVEADFRLGQVYHALGDYRHATDVLIRAVEPLEGDLVHERFGAPIILSVLGRNWLVRSLAELGAFAEGIAHGYEGIRISEAVDQPIDRLVAYQGIGFLYLRKGDLPQAISVLRRGLELCRAWNIPVWFPQIASALGSAYALSGRVADALPLLEQAVEKHAAMRRMEGHPLLVIGLSEGLLMAGRLEEASQLGQRAFELSRAHKERGHEAWALRLLGDMALRSDPPDVEQARNCYGEGFTIAEEFGMRPLMGHCHLGLGRLYRRTGHPSAGQEHIAAATTLFREMEMRFLPEEGTPQ
jgi:tetratricopeptide (TPR) repeat protein